MALGILTSCRGWRATRWLAGLLAIAAVPAAAQPAGAAVVVQIRNGAQPGALEVRASAPTVLAPELIVEQKQADGSFAAVRNLDLGSLRLTASCEAPTGRCVAIGPAGLRPVPWSGMSCAAQCPRDCAKNVRLHGQFRFVVRSCDHRLRYEGPPFSL